MNCGALVASLSTWHLGVSRGSDEVAFFRVFVFVVAVVVFARCMLLKFGREVGDIGWR